MRKKNAMEEKQSKALVLKPSSLHPWSTPFFEDQRNIEKADKIRELHREYRAEYTFRNSPGSEGKAACMKRDRHSKYPEFYTVDGLINTVLEFSNDFTEWIDGKLCNKVSIQAQWSLIDTMRPDWSIRLREIVFFISKYSALWSVVLKRYTEDVLGLASHVCLSPSWCEVIQQEGSLPEYTEARRVLEFCSSACFLVQLIVQATNNIFGSSIKMKGMEEPYCDKE